MVKKGRLSKDEIQYITDNAADGAQKISADLDRSVAIVAKQLDADAAEEKTEDPSPKAGELMARNETYGSVVMTESASIVSDESRNEAKKEDPDPTPVRYRGAIHRIKE